MGHVWVKSQEAGGIGHQEASLERPNTNLTENQVNRPIK